MPRCSGRRVAKHGSRRSPWEAVCRERSLRQAAPMDSLARRVWTMGRRTAQSRGWLKAWLHATARLGQRAGAPRYHADGRERSCTLPGVARPVASAAMPGRFRTCQAQLCQTNCRPSKALYSQTTTTSITLSRSSFTDPAAVLLIISFD